MGLDGGPGGKKVYLMVDDGELNGGLGDRLDAALVHLT